MSQIATSLQRNRRLGRAPHAFTVRGCPMLANILRFGRAAKVSVLLIRAFARLRIALAANAELAQRVEELSREVERQGGNLVGHHGTIQALLDKLRHLTQFPEEPKRGIGFTAPWPQEE